MLGWIVAVNLFAAYFVSCGLCIYKITNIKNKSWNNYDLRSRSLKLPFGASRLASH
ncbi:hypothetical protein HanIR_Chr13g0661831 [Helianthus annuus]|nr:hypothetical protein HanIR_Chr13g0661831 [Helianthus annuus]